MIDDFAKEYLRNDLREIREVILWKLDGLGEYDARRPLTSTGTNLLGLVKHLALWESRYFGEVFDRPFPEPLPRWDEPGQRGTDLWATEHETREEIIGRYRRAWAHSDATIAALAIDAPGRVPWWPRPDVTLFTVLVHMLTETSRRGPPRPPPRSITASGRRSSPRPFGRSATGGRTTGPGAKTDQGAGVRGHRSPLGRSRGYLDFQTVRSVAATL